ncbi:hypothetical protein AB0K09_18225 [Streptomyces sp. NPDC049577]|uniref:hypothetical protein n=1 Tax=Streptomyces sp. NPDC049577 TaxID=3155153 RepID=UPI00341AD5E5
MAVALVAGAAVPALAGCDPVGGLDTVAVAVTTQKQAAAVLQRDGVRVAWLSCQGRAERGGPDEHGSPRPVTAVGVDCEGRTEDGRKIIVFGTVTGISGDACVRGRLTAKVDGRTVFTASVLGDCSRASTGTPTGDGWSPPPTTTEKPGPSHHPHPSPSCSSTFRGK